jgi:L-lactate utilization protein LutC
MTERDAFFTILREALGRPERDEVPDNAGLLHDVEGLDERVAAILDDSRERSGELLAALEESATRAGCIARRVESLSAASEYVLGVVEEHHAGAVVQTGHPVLQDIGLAQTLGRAGIELFGTGSDGMSGGVVGEKERQDLREKTLEAGVGVTGVDYAVAETGSAVVIARPGIARLASLLPPVHVAVVRSGQVLAGMDELFTLRRRDLLRNPGRDYMNIISGPSRSADIEYTIVTGVHGPGEVHMVLVQ